MDHPTSVEPGLAFDLPEAPADSEQGGAAVEQVAVPVYGPRERSALIDFARSPATPEATALTAELAQRVMVWEATSKTRRKRSVREQQALVDAVGRLAGALAVAVDDGELGLLGWPQRSNWFSGKPVSYRLSQALHAAMTDGLGLVDVETKGSWHRIPEFGPGAGMGYVQRIRPTGAWVDMLRGAGIEESEARRHFRVQEPSTPVTLRAKNRRIRGEKVRGHLLPLPDTAAVERARAEVDELNRFIRPVQVAIPDGVEFAGWTRTFNDGDGAGADLGRGGRLIAQPGTSYQGLSEEARGRITLNGLPVVEIDITACHLTLVYAAHGLSLADDDRDPYAVEGVPRGVVKRWVTITLGKGSPPRKWKAADSEKLARKSGIDLAAYPVDGVTATILARHPVLNDLSGHPATTLQYQESEVIVATMLRLNRDHGIPVLPVHDSIIVPHVWGWTAAEALKEEFAKVVGQPMLPPKFSRPIDDPANF
ncbi:MAG TPA: hypothetical protein PKA13_08955 [Geminicoccaceae bacterium]|nr:hypothetical protein [Geminicoccaceae bacterium]